MHLQASYASREARMRRLADRLGLALRKSRVRGEPNLDDLGGYMIIDRDGNYVVRGARFELDLDDVEAYLNAN